MFSLWPVNGGVQRSIACGATHRPPETHAGCIKVSIAVMRKTYVSLDNGKRCLMLSLPLSLLLTRPSGPPLTAAPHGARP